MKPTILTLTVQVLGGPILTDRAALAEWVSAYRAPTDRHREVLDYLHRVSAGLPPRQSTARGSLKHFLWWLRDHAGSLYEDAVRATIQAVIDHPDWGLGTIADHLTTHPALAGFAQQALQSDRAEDLAHHLTWEHLPRGHVAWNRTTLNLSKVAFRAGADFYAAVSREGGCLMAKRGQTIEGFPVRDGWTQPYPNLVVLSRPGTLDDEAAMRAWLERAP